MPGPFHTIDVICARRQALIYVSPPFCEVDFSSTGEPVIVLNPFRRRRGPTGLVVIAGGILRFRWDSSDGAICYSLYRREGGEYVLVAECIGECVGDECTFECDACPPGCYAITAITEDGETEPSNEVCTEGCDVTITTTSPLPDGAFNAPYSFQLDQEFGQEATEQWSIIDGALPAGLALSTSGLISGTPTDGGNFVFTAAVEALCTESTGDSDEKAFLLNIAGGPEPTCILRIQDYNTVTQPIFIGHPDSPVSADPEWDGVWNFLIENVLYPEDYYYKGSNGIHEFPGTDPDPRIGPNIAVGGKGVSKIELSGPNPPSGTFLEDWWELQIVYFPQGDVTKRTWLGYKVGGNTTEPTGVYVNFMFPGFPTSDLRPSVTVELCP